MAEQLAYYYVNYGDWRKLFTGIDDIDKVTAEDVQRVARQYFTPEDADRGLHGESQAGGGAANEDTFEDCCRCCSSRCWPARRPGRPRRPSPRTRT